MTAVVRRNPKSVALLLLTAIFTVSVAGQDASRMAAGQARPAPCHHQGSTAPHPEPVSYRCCQSGHNFALLQASLDSPLHFADATLRTEFPGLSLLNPSRQSLLVLPISSTDTPDITPLRV